MTEDNEFHTTIADPEKDIGFAIMSFGPTGRSCERHIVMMGCEFHGVSLEIKLSPVGAERLAARLLSMADQARRIDRQKENQKQAQVNI